MHELGQTLNPQDLAGAHAQTYGEVCVSTNSAVGDSVEMVLTNSFDCVIGTCVQCQVQIEAAKELRCFWCVELMCWKCWEMNYGQCSKCARTISRTNDASRMAYARKVKRGGRPKTMRRCPSCKVRFSARELRKHKPGCAGVCAKVCV